MRNTIALAIVAVMALAGSGQAATLEEILAKNLAARGGEARLKEIKTLKMTGRLIFGGDGFGFEAAWGQLQKRGSAGADLRRRPNLRRRRPEASRTQRGYGNLGDR